MNANMCARAGPVGQNWKYRNSETFDRFMSTSANRHAAVSPMQGLAARGQRDAR